MYRLFTGVTHGYALIATVLALFALVAMPATAQTNSDVQAMQQVALTDAQVQGYVKVGPKLAKMFDRIDKAGGEPDAKLQAELEAIAKEGGFKSFEEMEIVVSNITFVMSGMNEETGGFTEPVDVLKAELQETEADKEIKADEKAQMIASIKESIASTPKLAYPENVAVVKKHFKALSTLFQE